MPLPWPTFPILGSRLVSEFRGDFNDIITGMLTAFVGVDEPTPKYAGQWWVDTSTTPKLVKQRSSNNTTWIVRFRIDQDWGGLLPLVGGTMEGPIDMAGFAITNLPAGSGAAPVRYSDLAPYAKLDGSTPFTGIPSGPGADPSLANQLARKAYVDAKAIAGGTFTGKITMPFPPVAGSQEVARAIDLENTISTHNHSGGVGQGVKIPVTSISPTGGSAGSTPHHDGTNVVWAGSGVLFDPPGVLTLWSTSGGVALTTVDLSSYIPSTARMVILELTFTYDGRPAIPGPTEEHYFTVDLRRTGASSFYAYAPRVRPRNRGTLLPDSGLLVDLLIIQDTVLNVPVYLDVLRRMDYRVTLNLGGGFATSIGKLIGYV